jgi:hypothetical protein
VIYLREWHVEFVSTYVVSGLDPKGMSKITILFFAIINLYHIRTLMMMVTTKTTLIAIVIMTITITTLMIMVMIIKYLFAYMLTQELNGEVQNRHEYTKNDVYTYK